jgi:hypothetical protein
VCLHLHHTEAENAPRLKWRVGREAWRRAGGGRCGGWWLRVAAVANCGATDRLVGSVSPRAAAPGSLAGVLCPESLQPPQAPDGGGTAADGRRARPGDGLPPPAPTQTSGGLLTVIECAYTCITRRRRRPKLYYGHERRIERLETANGKEVQTWRRATTREACRASLPTRRTGEGLRRADVGPGRVMGCRRLRQRRRVAAFFR